MPTSVLRWRWFWGAVVIVGWAAVFALARVAEKTIVDCGLNDPSAAKEALYIWALVAQGAVFVASIAGAVASRRGPRVFAFIAFVFSALASLVFFAVLFFYGVFVVGLSCDT